MNMEAFDTTPAAGRADLTTARLRILETTDLHMQLLGYDYFSDQTRDGTGLIHLASTIDALRNQDDIATLLFDNGDFIQGNPLADHIASEWVSGQTHPMVAALNTLKYDATTLGNHEFNYGLDFLQDVLADATFPVTCANITHLQGDPLAQPYLILDRDLICDDGIKRRLRVGVIGFVTPQITDWDKAALSDQLKTDDIVASATIIVPQMKAAGADIVVALCHSGIGSHTHSQRMENAAVPLAAINGIDVILTGHTHEFFPGDSVLRSDTIDPDRGTIHGKPTVMAGFYGNWLGVVDLELGWNNESWQIIQHRSRLQPGIAATSQSPLQKQLGQHVQAAHVATLAHIRQPIAQTKVAIHSYFANVTPSHSVELLAIAQQEFITQMMSKTKYADIPVLSAASPSRVGGRAGVGNYINVVPGPVALRDAAAIYSFANTLCAVRRTGAQLRNWLEQAASHYAQITPGCKNQPLINPHCAAYNNDTIYGLSYQFDLSEPARHAADGSTINAGAQRVCELRYQGERVADDTVFIVATNSYRTNGGGGFKGAPAHDILFTSRETARDVLVDYLRNRGVIDNLPKQTWGFVHHPNTAAVFQSAPEAKEHCSHGVTHLGTGRDGFDTYKFTF